MVTWLFSLPIYLAIRLLVDVQHYWFPLPSSCAAKTKPILEWKVWVKKVSGSSYTAFNFLLLENKILFERKFCTEFGISLERFAFSRGRSIAATNYSRCKSLWPAPSVIFGPSSWAWACNQPVMTKSTRLASSVFNWRVPTNGLSSPTMLKSILT